MDEAVLSAMYDELYACLKRVQTRHLSFSDRDQSPMMDLSAESYANGVAWCIAQIEGRTKREVLEEVRANTSTRPKPKRVLRRPKVKSNG